MSVAASYWHGGAPGLAVGSPLLSPRDAAAAGLPIVHTPRDRPEHGLVSRADRVYFSTSQDFARAYAFKPKSPHHPAPQLDEAASTGSTLPA